MTSQHETASPVILIADDEEANRKMLLDMLRRDGYEVLMASDGAEAVNLFATVRIMTTGDIYDSLTTDRPYRSALSSERAFVIMHEEVKRSWWDALMVEEFEKLIFRIHRAQVR